MGLAVEVLVGLDSVEMVDDVAATTVDATGRAEIQATWVSEGWG